MANLHQAAEVIRTWQKRHRGELDNNTEWAAQNLAIDLLIAGLLVDEKENQ